MCDNFVYLKTVLCKSWLNSTDNIFLFEVVAFVCSKVWVLGSGLTYWNQKVIKTCTTKAKFVLLIHSATIY